MTRTRLRVFPSSSAIGVLFALAYLLAHLPYLSPSLEDIDSFNFALAIQDFDPARHRPHPPGYPVYVALGKLASTVLEPEARALAIWGVLFGALSLLPLIQLFSCFEHADAAPDHGHKTHRPSLTTVVAAVLTMASPLLWFTAVRPMSDVPGLFLALLAQALLATALVRQHQARVARPADRPTPSELAMSGRLIVVGTFVAALAIGLRSQAAWLTFPLLLIAILDRVGEDAAGAILGSAASASLGVLLWAAPTIVVTGGPSRYFAALFGQGSEDFAGVEMLATSYSPRLAMQALWRTFVDPWAEPALGLTVLVSAAIGAAALLLRRRRAVLLLCGTFVPYALFHLIFQETLTVRYALPLLPAVTFAAVYGLHVVVRKLAPAAALILAGLSVWIAQPQVVAYASKPSPIASAVSDLAARKERPTVAMHHVFARAFEVAQPGAMVLPAPPRREWLQLVGHWTSGGETPLWFLADPKRTDLALVDGAARTLVRTYRWPFDHAALLGGVRPGEVDWYEIMPPGWFASEGFALTPEIAGVSREMGRGPSRSAIRAWVRRRPNAAIMVVGGRHLGGPSDGPAVFRASLNGRVFAAWTVEPSAFFLRSYPLPAGALLGDGRYSPLEIRATATSDTAPAPPTSVEQFDLQDAGRVVFGFGDGWYEPEYSPATGARWRWSSDRAVLRVWHAGQSLTLQVRGESPLRYFEAPPLVTVRSDSHVLARESPTTDFRWTIRVPRSTLESPEGRITLESDRTFVPAERGFLRRSADRRRLGLRIYSITVTDR